MKIGCVLLSKDGYYVDKDGKLPTRPEGDKEFLIELCRNNNVICSKNTYSTLPKSLKAVCRDRDLFKAGAIQFYDINLGISTFSSRKPPCIIVIESADNLFDGKLLRLDDYEVYDNKEAIYSYINIKAAELLKKLPFKVYMLKYKRALDYYPIDPELLESIEIVKSSSIKDTQQFNKEGVDKKLKYSLIEPEFLEDVSKVLTFGANKYGDNNWKKCKDKSIYIDAVFRHLEAYRKGEIMDKDTNVSHMAHICCNIMFLHYMERQ